VIEGDNRNAVIAVYAVEGRSQGARVKHIGVTHICDDAFSGKMLGVGRDLVFEALHEDIVAFRQNETEAVFAAAGKTGGKAVRMIVEGADGGFHPLGIERAHSRAGIEYTVNGGHADPSARRNILNGCPCHGRVESHGEDFVKN
jgi:hypothetical protein